MVDEAFTVASESFKAPAADTSDHDMVDATENTAEDVDDPHIFDDPRIYPLDEDHLDDMWSANSLLSSAKAVEEAEAAPAAAGAARQHTCSPTECLLKVN